MIDHTDQEFLEAKNELLWSNDAFGLEFQEVEVAISENTGESC